ncbi:aldehyde dehydrogenase family protein [Azospirillum sp. SYSU D00513]|uniref:aldehyde dehydrogenase family protein n=1 Tax=Azospirillum sp. SYSU D00513 TaxID=2812561 RepID=UPI001A95C6D3|nr:aldehyde dehydrogenase family protein [Azospirillum sp. SYSU D00513]
MDHRNWPPSFEQAADSKRIMAKVRDVGPAWAERSAAERLAPVRALRRRIAAEAGALVEALSTRPGRSPAESLSGEILPLAEACRFLEREAERILAVRRLGRRGRPVWLFGVEAEVRREPFGTVLVIAPSNYPLLLPGVQTVQALVAGNAVLVKPAPGCSAPMELLRGWLAEAGLPDGLLHILGDSPAEAEAAIAAGVDKVVLTGSAATGRRVMAQLAERLVPATMELSGNDAVFVLPGADLDLAARALAFGLRFNGSATCIAPRRVFVPRGMAAELETLLLERVAELPATPVPLPVRLNVARLAKEAREEGARPLGSLPSAESGEMAPLILADARPDMAFLREDIFAPVLALVPVADMGEALAFAAKSPYALGASVFGPDAAARALAARIDAGGVTVNDLIVPTADPRLPFGGRRASGWGVTRGAEGLLEMTQMKTVTVRPGRFRPYYDPPRARDEALMLAALQALHGEGRGRLSALKRLWPALRGRR